MIYDIWITMLESLCIIQMYVLVPLYFNLLKIWYYSSYKIIQKSYKKKPGEGIQPLMRTVFNMSVSAFLDIFPRNVSYHMVLKFVIRPGRDSTAVRFTVSYAISTYHHRRCEFEPWSGRGLFDTTLCNIVLQWLGADRWSFRVLQFNLK